MKNNLGPVRTAVYVDGFNLYGGALKRAPAGFRWLDLEALACDVLRPENQVDAVHYFTALIRPDGANDQSPQLQKAYIKALESYRPYVQTHYGHFLTHKARARPVDDAFGPLVDYWKVEEKGSDVNLSARLVADAFLGHYDCALLICNDGDMAEAVRIVRQEARKTVGVLLPIHHPSRPESRKASQGLCREANFVRELRCSAIRRCQLPDPIPGTKLSKPPHW